MLVANKADSHTNTLQLAAQHVDFAVTNVDSAEAALNAFVELQPEIVIIDARHVGSLTVGSPNAGNKGDQVVVEGKGQLNTVPKLDAVHVCK